MARAGRPPKKRLGRPPKKDKEVRRPFYIRVGEAEHSIIQQRFKALQLPGESFNEFGLKALQNELDRRAQEAKKTRRS